MTYIYRNPDDEKNPYSLPDVDIFSSEYWITEDDHGECTLFFYESDVPEGANVIKEGYGWFYASGYPGCLWDSEPMGPYQDFAAATYAARKES